MLCKLKLRRSLSQSPPLFYEGGGGIFSNYVILSDLTIYDMLGRQVKILVNQRQDAGYRSVIWNATNDYGKPVSAGIYLYQIQAGEYISTKKMALLK